MSVNNEHKSARLNLFKSFGESVNDEAFDYVATDDGVLVEYTKGKEYLPYQDLGVQGAVENSRAPRSPFNFGPKSRGTHKAPPNINFEYWMLKKGIAPRDKKGRFIPRKQIRYLIARSIYIKGIRPKNYWKDIEKDVDQLTKDVIALDLKYFSEELDRIIEIYD